MEKTIEIGEFRFHPNDLNTVELPYQSSAEMRLSLILQDNLGRPITQKNVALRPGANSLSLQLPRMKEGEYYAWLSIGNKTFIRTLSIQRAASSWSTWARMLGF